MHGIRVFADLVPGALLDLEPGATAALLELERAVADRPEYLPLATQLHVLATALRSTLRSGWVPGLRVRRPCDASAHCRTRFAPPRSRRRLTRRGVGSR